MHPIFSIISTPYIFGIFILPGVVPNSLLSRVWNPYSLLHIPLYGIVMIFLVLTFEPSTLYGFTFFLPGGIATEVGMLDEFLEFYAQPWCKNKMSLEKPV